MSERPKGFADGAAQWFGILVFLAGIGLIILTFSTALRLFGEPSLLLGALQNPKGKPADNLTLGIFTVVIKIAMLFAMMLAASLIAARGIQLFGAGGRDAR
ncbi:MAG: hypothetical protein IT210_02045 [Armatimonadetes bacterium]|nr:hypothetical protein [Armatimonadota bacterium]